MAYELSKNSVIYAVATLFAVLIPENDTMILVHAMQLLSIIAIVNTTRTTIAHDAPVLSRLEPAVLLMAAAALPPLLYFCLYFCLLHSPRHLVSIMVNHGASRSLATAMLFTLLSLVLAGIAWLLLPLPGIDDKTISVLFIGLAALTVPHMLVLRHAESLRSS